MKSLTLYTSLQLVGFEKTGTRQISRGNISVSLRIGYWAHWYVTTPYGVKDYQSQAQALHVLVGYRFVTREDLEKMTELGYAPAKKELEKYTATIEMYSKKISTDMKRSSHVHSFHTE